MSASKIIDMTQERAGLTKSIRDALDAPVRDDAAIKNLEEKFDVLNASISTETKQLARERLLGEAPAPTDPAKPADEKKIAFQNFLRFPDRETMKVYNALQQDNPTQAGYLVPDEQFVMSIIKDLADICIIRKKATVYQLKNALSLGFPMRTAGMSSAAWGTEISAPTADTTLAYGKKELRPNPASSLILVSESLIRNSPVVEREVREAIVEDLDMLQETAFMTGDGAGKPLGIFTASVDGIPASRDIATGNTATEMKVDGLMNAMFSVKGAARVGAEWLFHRNALLQLIKLKTSDGQYIWQPLVTQGVPGLLLGAPFNDSEYAPNTFTTGLYVGIYGNLKNYLIADSLEMRFKVLGELYALTNQIGYITRIETDGCPVRPNAWARIKLG